MYIEQAYKGLSDPWRYIIGIIVVFIGWQFIGAIPLMSALIAKTGSLDVLVTSNGDIGILSDILGPNTLLFFSLLMFVVGLLFLFLCVLFLHKQSITALTTAREKIDWRRVFFAFGLWAFISVAFIFLDIFLAPEDYVFNFQLEPFLVLLAIAMLMLPLQTSMEEYYIRGYMMQGLGVTVKNRWFPLVFTSLLFGLLHIFNPEVDKLGYGVLIFYIGTGFFLGIITLMDDGLELALGFHAANNITAALLVTANWTAFQTPSVYLDVSDPVLGWDVLIPVFVVYPILLYVFAKRYHWSGWQEKLTGKIAPEHTTTDIT